MMEAIHRIMNYWDHHFIFILKGLVGIAGIQLFNDATSLGLIPIGNGDLESISWIVKIISNLAIGIATIYWMRPKKKKQNES